MADKGDSSNPHQVRTLMSQLKIANKTSAMFTVVPDRKDLKTWYVRISGIAKPYLGGEFIFCLVAPTEYPQKPPSLSCLTPNGVYDPRAKRICISVGEFHTNDKPGKDGAHGWRPSLGMHGFALQVANGLIFHEELGHGIGIIQTTDREKCSLAVASREYNARMYPEIIEDFESWVQENPTADSTKALLDGRKAMLPAATGEPAALVAAVAAVAAAPVAAVAAAPVAAVAAVAAAPVAADAAVAAGAAGAPVAAAGAADAADAPVAARSIDTELDELLEELARM